MFFRILKRLGSGHAMFTDTLFIAVLIVLCYFFPLPSLLVISLLGVIWYKLPVKLTVILYRAFKVNYVTRFCKLVLYTVKNRKFGFLLVMLSLVLTTLHFTYFNPIITPEYKACLKEMLDSLELTVAPLVFATPSFAKYPLAICSVIYKDCTYLMNVFMNCVYILTTYDKLHFAGRGCLFRNITLTADSCYAEYQDMLDKLPSSLFILWVVTMLLFAVSSYVIDLGTNRYLKEK